MGVEEPVPGDPDAVERERMLALAEQCFELARAGSADTLAGVVDAGLPVDLTDASGNTLLMLAAYHGHAPTVSVLLARGADPGTVNDRGQTPLAGAVFKRAADVVAVLVEAGADPEAGAPSALATARFYGYDDLLRMLGGTTDAGQAGTTT